MTAKLENLELAAKFEKNNQWRELLNFSNQWVVEEPENVFAWQAMGDALRKLGRPAEAIAILCKGIEFAPPHPVDFMGKVLSAAPLWYRLAHAYSESGKFELSIEAFKEAARIDPMATDIWNDLGVAYANNNDYKGAFEAFKKAVDADPTNTNSIKNLGLVYAKCGVEQGVSHAHSMLLKLNTSSAKEFLAQAKDLLSNR
ncbi:tetratricopeptide repeat protein [Pseudomonas rubra]|uniref:Tetratricopeptide repeat protein n=1 Tax=Pseudomonas rubra TaxID=2942627 RepID=A0ABT5P7N4_9PSED|nr:tetratricopeptide repeat protein [Pseudomonas rubra]MDD1014310.1 tetratricopeptide repeat protein [Pseudomonas rubra]MDD1038067.1 tetratricopeptide repeat protein [Pseudomonas rubra]MDD1155500.1 tetratricopeptide repeat protein [Pseudomonas rubra]